LRRQPCCCGCFQAGPCDAAHIRASSHEHGKPITGIGTKADDRWAVPLLHAHHMRQHAWGDERGWWMEHGVADPFALAQNYYRRYCEEVGKEE
jgi:hypothetical protein